MERPKGMQRERGTSSSSSSLDVYSPCHFLYSPCHFLEMIVKALSKCLCLDSGSDERGGEGTCTTSQAMRRPPRPPLSAGRGGQVNLISS
ncbi:hypothetical protein RIF29_11140 [Crotalaria pallida]|uniref:Uncharacterized protein n=1 Tax=Crotalaria pallida TaxID=3830 RepID=A0AAN9ILV0_CROPI